MDESLELNKLSITIGGEIFEHQRVGGVGRYVVELMSNLKELGHDVRLDSLFHRNHYLREFKAPSLYLPIDFRGYESIATSLARAANRCFITRSRIVHCSYYRLERFQKHRGPKFFTIYDMIQERIANNLNLMERKKKCADWADHIFAISESTKNDAVNLLNLDPSKITVTPLATKFCSLTTLNLEQPFPGDSKRKYLLWVGARHGHKNFRLFVEAFALSRAAKEGTSILCFGGPPIAEVEMKIFDSLGIVRERVQHSSGNDEELQAAYTNALALVYPSIYEGFGIPPLEAMSLGCPVIVSNTSSLPEVVGKAAILVSPNEREEIAEAIDKITFDSSLRRALIAAGKDQAAKFSWRKCAEQTTEVYRRFVS